MCVERDLLGADHELCAYSMSSKQTGDGRGALQAKHISAVPDAGQIDRAAQFLDRGTARRLLVHPAVPHCGMESRKIPAPDVKPKADQFQICG